MMREELTPGGETTAEERQTGVLWTDGKPHLANNGASINLRLDAVNGHPELALSIANRPLMRVEARVFRKQTGMQIQAAAFKQLEHFSRNDDGTVRADQPSFGSACEPPAFAQKVACVHHGKGLSAGEFCGRVALRIGDDQGLGRRVRCCNPSPRSAAAAADIHRMRLLPTNTRYYDDERLS